MKPVHRSATLGERFFAGMPQQADENGCLNWTRGKNKYGYGHFRYKGKLRHPHRLSWELYHQHPIPDGAYILHSCDNPACINPEHLHIGTHADNMREKVERGRVVNRTFTESDVIKIRQIAASGISQSEIARQLGVGVTTVRYIVKRRTWRHI